MRLHKLENLLIGLIFIFLTACGSPPLIRPEGQTTPEQETAAETVTLAATQEAVEAKSTSPLPTPMVIPVATATEPLAVATPVSPLPTPIATEPPGGGYSADKVSLIPVTTNLDLRSSESAEPKINFGGWSNSGKKFNFGVVLPELLTDPTEPKDNNFYGYASEQWIANVDGTEARKIFNEAGISVRWSPDDTQLAFYTAPGANKRQLWVIDLKTITPYKLDTPDGLDINNTDFYGDLEWLDNGHLLYPTYSKNNQRLWLHDVQTGKISEILVNDKLANWRDLKLAPNKELMIGRTENDLWLGKLVEENGQFRLDYIKTLITEDSLIPYWSPGSTKIALVSIGLFSSELRVIDINSGNIVRIPFESAVMATEWSPDSRVLIVSNYVTGSGPKSHPIYVVNADGSGLRLLDSSADTFIEWSPDGQHLFLKRPETEDTPSSTNDIFKVEVK